MQIRIASAAALTALCIASAAIASQGEDEQHLRIAERTICAAYEAENADWLATHLDSQFTLTSSRGEVTTREQEVAALRGGKIHYDVFRNHD